jgi:hypothetical protein
MEDFMRRASMVALAAVGLTALALAGIGGIAAPVSPLRIDNRPSAIPVDVELVLAVDISYSMDPEEQTLQKEGYIAALTSREFMQAIRQGMHGKIAITYFEWAGAHIQHMVVPWRVIDGPETADSVANDIARSPLRRGARTSISGALLYAMPLFDSSGYRGIRKVIDVSGDGTNNHGPLVTLTRDDVLTKGITINGLPIMLKRPNFGGMDLEELDVYFEDCVIGGPGAFVVPIRERNQFKDAIRTKLVLEVAGRMPKERVIPAAADKPRVSCTIGERMWQQRWGN